MPNFSIALSGLNADSQALNTIANNLSNMNATAYKEKTTNFADMFYQSIGSTGSGNPIQVGAGTKIASTSTNYTQGSSNTTNTSSSDMEIAGNGFFVVSDGSQNYLTRNGQFTQNTSGYLETSSGDKLMGYAATNGVISSTSLSPIEIPTAGTVMAPSASTEMTISCNLNSATAVNGSFSSTTKLYDTQGTEHSATITYTKTATDTWSYSISLPNSDYTSGTSTPITGSFAFDASGNLSTVTYGSPASTSTVGTAAGNVSSIPVSFTGLSDGASNLSMKWNLLDTSGNQIIGQVASANNAKSSIADGYAAGIYDSFAVDSDGKVRASYKNGQTMVIGQVAVADVANEQGLSSLGSSLYKTTTSSGDANIGIAGTGSLGTVTDSALEQSNVDISTEFANLIIAQRAFEANSKSITTFDTVTQQAIGMIR
ncbi:MAG: flagellar hook protein FlgE [Terracidiphilus sp.]|nr:flagellar hook protein FlgE [Terracidiphilus sp.]